MTYWGFGWDTEGPSLLRVVFLGALFGATYLNPDYRWPEDYLERDSPFVEKIPTRYLFGAPITFQSTTFYSACDAHMMNQVPKFDYIVVGSGAGGLTVAYRLALQNRFRRVLLIEAGGYPSINSPSPRMHPYNIRTSYTFNYFAEITSTYSLAYKYGANNICGKSMGGSTAVNAMMYVCGTDQNYNNWATLSGDSAWNYANMLPYIKKHQSMKDTTLTSGTCASYHGTTGPIKVSDMGVGSDTDVLIPLLRNAIVQKGYRELKDINCGPYNSATGTPGYNGFVNTRFTVDFGQRASAAKAMVTKMGDNLFYLRNSTALKLNTKIDATGIQITGVVVSTLNESCNPITFQASREIILAAGALSTPKILQSSGFGKASDLNECNIPVRKDLPVGENLMEHIMSVQWYTIPGSANPLWDLVNTTAYLAVQSARYTSKVSTLILPADGYFSKLSSVNYNGFINTLNNDAAAYPDIQYICYRFDQYQPDFIPLMAERFAYKQEYVDQFTTVNNQKGLIMCFNVLLQPVSRGTVKLRNCGADPFAHPVIDGNYLSNPSEVDTLLRGIRALDSIFTTTTGMQNAGVTRLRVTIPECDNLTYDSDSYWKCYIKYFTATLYHPSGTCRMGQPNSPTSVVDTTLKVIGVSKGSDNLYPWLRIADASIIPLITSGNTQCPVYTIGEKAADLIIAANP